jgi:hypothetical protein
VEPSSLEVPLEIRKSVPFFAHYEMLKREGNGANIVWL